MSLKGNDSLTSSFNDIDPACKSYVNDNDYDNFKKELIKLLEERLKEISGRLFSIVVKIENGLKN